MAGWPMRLMWLKTTACCCWGIRYCRLLLLLSMIFLRKIPVTKRCLVINCRLYPGIRGSWKGLPIGGRDSITWQLKRMARYPLRYSCYKANYLPTWIRRTILLASCIPIPQANGFILTRPILNRQPFTRITSYNVCYTKLLRDNFMRTRIGLNFSPSYNFV